MNQRFTYIHFPNTSAQGFKGIVDLWDHASRNGSGCLQGNKGIRVYLGNQVSVGVEDSGFLKPVFKAYPVICSERLGDLGRNGVGVDVKETAFPVMAQRGYHRNRAFVQEK